MASLAKHTGNGQRGFMMISNGQADIGPRDLVIIGNGQADSGQRCLVIMGKRWT